MTALRVFHLLVLQCAVLPCAILPAAVGAQGAGDPESGPRTWYVAAGASGDGRSAASPFGSTGEVEAASAAGDIVVVLPGAGSLDGGLALKPRQILRGVVTDSRRPIITNTTEDRNGGIGIVLSEGTRVEGIEIRDTRTSGIFGRDVGTVVLSDVTVHGANTGRGLIVANPLAPFPHGGVALDTSPGAGGQVATLTRVRVVDAAGMGIGTAAAARSQVTLQLHDVEVTGGAGFGNADFGIAAMADGPAAEVSLNMARSRVRGRMTPAARNVVLGAGNEGTTRGMIYESVIGASGQDGILAVLSTLPGTVDLSIVGSTVENGAQSNVEGTFLAFPHSEADLLASSMSISIHRSTIRNAGGGPLFGDRGAGVLMTGSFIPPGPPLPAGRYALRITDSEVEGSSAFGVALGSHPELPTADPGHFQVLVRGTRFQGNQLGDIMVGGPNARVDARRNCWSAPDGQLIPRVVSYWIEGAAPVDTSAPTTCVR